MLDDRQHSCTSGSETSPAALTPWLPRLGHDLRASLAAIHGYAGLLDIEVPGPLNPAQRVCVEGICEQVTDLGWKLEIALAWLRLHANLEDPVGEPSDLAACIERITNGLRSLAAARGVALTLSLPGEPVRVVALPGALTAALGLVVGQAVRLGPPAGRVAINVVPVAGGVVDLRVEVDGDPPDESLAMLIAGPLAAGAGGEVEPISSAVDGRAAWSWTLRLPIAAPVEAPLAAR